MTQKSQEIIQTYNGNLTFDIIEEILQSSKGKLDQMDLELVIKKRVYTILVECLENTYKHNVYITNKHKHSQVELVLEQKNGNLIVSVSNYVNKENLGAITQKIDKVNSLDLSGLNQLYRASISKARISEKGGAGLGIIEIARNSRQKINYKIIRENGSAIHFNLQVNIAIKAQSNC